MARLLERTACDGLGLPLALAGTTLSEVVLGLVTSIAPFRGQEGAVAEVLGASLPAPGRVQVLGDARLHWVGPGRALLVGELLDPRPRVA